jgi:hypothetical protein
MMTERPLTIQKRGTLFFLVDEEGEVVGLGYAHRRDAEEALGVLMRSALHSIRACISCKRPFESSGTHNRMCPNCRARA